MRTSSTHQALILLIACLPAALSLQSSRRSHHQRRIRQNNDGFTNRWRGGRLDYDYYLEDDLDRPRQASCFSLCNHKTRECSILRESKSSSNLAKYLTSVDRRSNNITINGETVAVLCSNCGDNTIGHRCETCTQGYYNIYHNNSRIHITECRKCKCNKSGSENMFCNSIDGYCKCRLGYRGAYCTSCIESYHHPILGQRRVPTKCVPNTCTTDAECRSMDTKASCMYGLCLCSGKGKFKGDKCEIRTSSGAYRLSITTVLILLLHVLLFI